MHSFACRYCMHEHQVLLRELNFDYENQWQNINYL